MTKDAYAQIAELVQMDDAEERETLRQAAEHDPLRNCPLVLRSIRGEEIDEISPGGWREEHADKVTGLPPGCPVTPLGSDGENFYFLNTLGQVHVLKASSSGKGPIDALFQGRGGYLEWAWPRYTKAGGIKGWEADECRRDLFAACAYKGTFELEDRVRGRGAWRDDDGALIYHAGDAVLCDGKWRSPGEIGRFIYPSRPRLGRPWPKYITAGEGGPGQCVLEKLETFNWERKRLDPRLALGWLMTAKIGGALERRPVTFITGEEGSGKSTYHMLLRILMNGALLATSNTTQAGIYQRVRQDSIAIMVDEMEAKDDTRTTDKIIELARIAYSGDKMQRGGKDGDGKEFALMSSFMGSSIAKPATGAQDDSRMAVMMMRPIEARAGDAPFEAREIEKWGRQLLRRAFDWYPRWDKLLQVFRQALIEVGHDSRSADTFGALAAGCHIALCDDMPDAAALDDWRGLLVAQDLTEISTKAKTWRRCFMMMLDVRPEALKQASCKSVSEILEDFKNNGATADETVRRLSNVGLSMSWPKDAPMAWETARLFVPSNHPSLTALFQHTPWAGRMGDPGPWNGVLRQMPAALIEAGKCDRGLDKKRAGLFVQVAKALEA